MKNILLKRNKVKKADIVVGIPSYNEADTIAFVVEQVDKGLEKYYKGKQCLIINVDNDSPDGTKKVFENTKTTNPKLYISTRPGIAGKGYNFYNLFKKAIELHTKIVIVVDADLKSISPEWMRNFAEPVFKDNYDFITPIYARHEYDGSITNHILYPLIYGLLGRNIRQPIGGDFALSDDLVKYLIKKRWIKTTKKYGIDNFLTLNAIFGNFKIGQTNLGAKIHKPSAPKLGPMFTQVVTTLFTNLIGNKKFWFKNLKVKRIPVLYPKEVRRPQDLPVDFKEMKTTALYLFKTNRDNLKKYLSRDVYREVSEIYSSRKMEIKPALWCRIVYDMLYAFEYYNNNSHFTEAFKPLYFGRAASFIKHTLELSYQEAEKEIKEQARVFYANRDYLLEKYKQS